MGRLTAAWLAIGIALAAAGAAGCTVELNRRPPPAKLRVLAVPDDAAVYLNEQFVGSARVLAAKPETLPEGTYRMTVTAPGYFPHDLMVKLTPGTTTVRIELRKIPP